MGWALTAVVLSSVSLLVVAVTLEHGSQTVGHRSGVTVSGSRTPILLRVLLSARAAAVTLGHRLGTSGRVAGRQAMALAVAVVQGVRARSRSVPRARPISGPRLRPRKARTRQVRFEDCLQTTGPELGATVAAPSLSLTPAPASRGWLSRLVAAVELVVVIALAGGAIAFALIAAGWKASRIF
jgi:hypothetical protein